MSSQFHQEVKRALRFASEKHLGQNENGSRHPYLVHLSDVVAEVFLAHAAAPEFDLGFAVVMAYLHDTLEDTQTTKAEIAGLFGQAVADGVEALTKSTEIDDKEQRLRDSISRILAQPKEVGIVKLADRISNLASPNLPWPEDKRKRYMEGSNLILKQLDESNRFLADRLRIQIREYVEYVVTGQ